MLARLFIPVLVLLWSGGLAQLQVQVSYKDILFS